ncbi:protein GrpE [Longispora fulva]|uniref:Protein GrpE n=1 Tax=Longispora fulva TaxID=619741 RepID=A0A8J7KIG3_9ACTN|nr:nucleotide exchange factor GrpE [Longispora fulva]MBG6133926.1 molecular chaperone GrpE [Longispora fulva]GIG62968.1 protein GrpE [Longispora fulva]
MTEPLIVLAEEVAGLRDLFQRRLLEDRGRQQLYDRLYQELEFGRKNLVLQFLAPVYRELLLILDRVGAVDAAPEPAVASMVDELTEVLARRGVRPIEALGLAFDPRWHEAVEQVPVEDPKHHDLVLAERRRGYLVDDALLRPAQVLVGRYAHDG